LWYPDKKIIQIQIINELEPKKIIEIKVQFHGIQQFFYYIVFVKMSTAWGIYEI